MSYASIMVHLAPGKGSDAPLTVAARLAQRFSAYLIGAAACPLLVDASGASLTAAAILEAQQREIEATFERLEAHFDDRATTTPLREWRDGLNHPTGFLVHQARAADLIVVGSACDEAWRVDRGEPLVRIGRPVLLVAPGCERLFGETIVVAWKNAPAAQRALGTAMPFLTEARRVCVVGVGDESNPDELEDVAESLRRHRVHAETAWRVAPARTTPRYCWNSAPRSAPTSWSRALTAGQGRRNGCSAASPTNS